MIVRSNNYSIDLNRVIESFKKINVDVKGNVSIKSVITIISNNGKMTLKFLMFIITPNTYL